MAGFSAMPRPFRHLWFRVLQIDSLIAMHIGDKPATLFIDATQKSRLFAVTAVNGDIAELNPSLPGDFKHVQRQLRFASK